MTTPNPKKECERRKWKRKLHRAWWSNRPDAEKRLKQAQRKLEELSKP
jgi:hypothetical protein